MNVRIAVIGLFICLAVSVATVQADVKIGMLAQRGSDIALEEWGPLAQRLGELMGEKVEVVPLKFTEVLDFCANEPAGFLFANSWFYVRAKVLRKASALVTAKYQGTPAEFGGVIFARKDSGIKTLNDIRGKVMICPKFSSAGGWLFEKGVLVRNDINPEKDCKLLVEAGTHDKVVMAVLEGKADVGTVRTNILETMQREGKIRIDEFVILNSVQHPGLNEVCSTPLYPDWPVASLKDTPPALAAKMKKALLSIPPGDPVLLRARNLERFIEAMDYGPLEELMKLLKMDAFKGR